MSNEIDTISAGEIAPYDPGMSPLAPLSPDSWGNTDVREIDSYQRQPQGQTLFGEPTQASPAQIESILGQLGGAFLQDFSSLGYPQTYINAAIAFVRDNAMKAPYQVTRQHNFNLHGNDDHLGHAFGNMVQGLSGSQKAKQQFVTAALQWLTKVNQKLNSQQVPTQPRTAPGSTEAMLSQLSDADYNKVVKINEQAKLQTLTVLENKYGPYTAQNMVALAQAYLEKLTPVERAHFDQFTTVNGQSWVALMNCAETIEFLYNASIGAGSIPANGADIAKEIAQFEAMLKVPSERALYLKDSALQARLRELYRRRGG